MLTAVGVVASMYWTTPQQCYGGTFGLHVMPLKSTVLISYSRTSVLPCLNFFVNDQWGK